MILKDFFVLQLKRKCSPAVALHAQARPDTPLSVMSEPDDVEEQRPNQEAPSVSSPSTAPACNRRFHHLQETEAEEGG